MLKFKAKSKLTLSVTLCLLTLLSTPQLGRAQFGGVKKKAMQIAFCGGGAYGGFKLGEKLAEIEAKKLKLSPEQAKQHLRAFQIGTAAALCAGSSILAGTVYGKLSERDRKARLKEMDLAMASTSPGVHMYVLPDSGYQGEVEQVNVEREDDQECKTMVDRLAGPNEPAKATFCRKLPNGKFDATDPKLS